MRRELIIEKKGNSLIAKHFFICENEHFKPFGQTIFNRDNICFIIFFENDDKIQKKDFLLSVFNKNEDFLLYNTSNFNNNYFKNKIIDFLNTSPSLTEFITFFYKEAREYYHYTFSEIVYCNISTIIDDEQDFEEYIINKYIN